MNSIEIKEQLILLINEKFKIEIDEASICSNESLLSKPFNLSNEDLVLLVAVLMEKFSIIFNEKDFTDYKFDNIDSIVGIITIKLEERDKDNGKNSQS